MTEKVILLFVYFIVGYIFVSFMLVIIKKNNSSSEDKDNSNLSNDTSKIWYNILEVPAESSLQEIKEAYKNKMRKYHPDKVGGLGKEFSALAEEKSKEINQAYEEGLKSYNGLNI